MEEAHAAFVQAGNNVERAVARYFDEMESRSSVVAPAAAPYPILIHSQSNSHNIPQHGAQLEFADGETLQIDTVGLSGELLGWATGDDSGDQSKSIRPHRMDQGSGHGILFLNEAQEKQKAENGGQIELTREQVAYLAHNNIDGPTLKREGLMMSSTREPKIRDENAPKQPVGLQNIGNSCYFNAFMQAVLRLPFLGHAVFGFSMDRLVGMAIIIVRVT